MQCAFVGAGAVAEAYAATLSASPLSLAAVCDTDADRAQRLANDHCARAFTDLEAALAATDAPLVVNLTSHAAHAAVTRQCLAADRHVYSEKPLALDPDAAAELLEYARDHDLALGCAPHSPHAPAQCHAGRLLADGRLGTVRLGYAHAHVGRVTEWHDRPESLLDVGPLYDGGVYPLAVLVSWFGPVERVRVADALSPWPDHDSAPSAPSHVEATLDFVAGPTVRLTASLYAPHRSREFYGLELHGDDGSLYLRDAGAFDADADSVVIGGLGREYTAAPSGTPDDGAAHLDAVDAFAASIAAGERPRETARRGAHVVAVCAAIDRAVEEGGPVDVPTHGAAADHSPTPVVRPPVADGGPADSPRSIRLPPIGFGCSRYRGDGEYVDRIESIATALDAGYRLLDSAELYGNEHRIGDLLAAPGTPDRESLFLLGKVWNTNHGHVAEACRGSLAELGVDAFDCYTLHWPDAWAYQGPLERLAERPPDEQAALAFPTDDGERTTADISLAEAWRNLEAVHGRGLARTLGLCNVTREQVETVLASGTTRPALVQIERHPYRPQSALVEFCHERGIRVVAHSPLSAPGLLDEPILADIAAERDCSPAAVVLAWNVAEGVVPIPSSTTTTHIVANRAATGLRLTESERAEIATLRDPEFER